MKMPNVKEALKKGSVLIQKNSSTILTGCAVGGVVVTTVCGCQATIKAVQILQEEEGYLICTDKVDAKEAVKLCWTCYVPTILMAGLTIACAIGAHTIDTRRNAVLASLYTVSQKALEEYKTTTEQIVGKKKAGEIKEALADEIMKANPYNPDTAIHTGKGNTLCYDPLSGRYFFSDINSIRQAQNDFNHWLIGDYALSLNELYQLLSLDTIRLGDDVGWNVNRMLDFEFLSRLASDGTPCLVLDHKVPPIADYQTW